MVIFVAYYNYALFMAIIPTYRHIYFDLDRTLWDFETNAKETFVELLINYELKRLMSDSEEAFSLFMQINERMWQNYREGRIKKEWLRTARFVELLAAYSISDDAMAYNMGVDYIRISPLKTALVPGTVDMLEKLFDKHNLYIITNGFEEVQYLKLKNCGIEKYFKKMFTSDSIGVQKPNPEIFRHALKYSNARKTESLMVGDDLHIDILGAKKAGIDQVYYNPNGLEHNEKITFEINHLSLLTSILVN